MLYSWLASVAQVANKESHQAGWPSEAAEVHMEIKLADSAAKKRILEGKLLQLLYFDFHKMTLFSPV